MHIYKTSPKYKIFVWAVIALFYLFAISFLAYSVFFFGYSMCAIAAINCVFDFSAPVEEIVKDNGEMITVLLHKGLLGIKWY